MSVRSDIRAICAGTPRQARLTQLAEECMELGQAALKLRRAMGYGTATPVSIEEAESDLQEEMTDVLSCIEVCQSTDIDGLVTVGEMNIFKARIEAKLHRWAEREMARQAQRCRYKPRYGGGENDGSLVGGTGQDRLE